MNTEVFGEPTRFLTLINESRAHLSIVRKNPAPEPDPDSPARLAFEPRVSRHLKTYVPIRVIPLPAQEDTWNRIGALLDGWQELRTLSQTSNISTWDVSAAFLPLILHLGS